ncbi:S-layer homology domain-containing protein [Nostoc sp. 'Peltigera membranacea cyanobiont' 232]|uniref:S-layer homology domain-containing protein n=1 Tax=Nostoc sp. 'Peltigera membranacea cyanobiont' 232 TaxID=2014531 RepID=UPI000B951F01|nr:S-layer homology domain-containing protein [Nostoc sp. 'Peltigera membranacea cyanobiont' 232]OYE05452.1 S-layer protein [Nostoc sp. 'Peltigera membranacea cyanobiont' 232]
MRQLSITLSLVALLQNLPAIAQVPETTSAIPSDSIQQVIAAKWMTNFSDGKFYPERLLSRAELASIMVKAFRLDKREAVSKENLVIPDVPRSYWAFNDIQTVLKTDIMKGYRGNEFFPNQKVTRAEALAIFAQAYGVFQFPDEAVNEILASHPDEKSIPTWARKAIATVASEGFLNTDTQGNIFPLKPVTRGDMAYVLSKYLQRQQQQPETPEVPMIPNSPQSP